MDTEIQLFDFGEEDLVFFAGAGELICMTNVAEKIHDDEMNLLLQLHCGPMIATANENE